MSALCLAWIDASLQKITVFERCASRLRQTNRGERSQRNPASPSFQLEAEEPVLRTADANAEYQSWNSGIGDVALRRTGTERGHLRRRQPAEGRRSGGHACGGLGGHPVDTLLCDDLHPNATACNLREAFVTGFARNV